MNNLKFVDGLIPAIVRDARSGNVLTLAYMNAESLEKTRETGETWFWSRSRNELWHKGATSGNTQRVVDIAPDCDGDALLAVFLAPDGTTTRLRAGEDIPGGGRVDAVTETNVSWTDPRGGRHEQRLLVDPLPTQANSR